MSGCDVGFQPPHGALQLAIDIETAPLPEAAEYLEPVEAPANYKDPEKIAAYIAEKEAEQLERCSLDPDLCRIVAIGWWWDDDAAATAATVGAVGEGALLERFWRAAADRHLVGFNCIGFDLPVLFRRSLYLGVPAPNIQIDKYRHPTITDLQQILSHNGAFRYRSLNFYSRRFGIAVPDHLTGADIAKAVKDGRWSDVEAHVLADVRKTALLAAKIGCFSRARESAIAG